ncbi:tetratricopeptide repeat protein [Streptomyces violaceus]|uniref:Tetratricopeptide repeat protein n=1 Tax=Streptomyces violaceus TaxID=1936 RepID=A0ABZ1NLN0_STRVL
MGTSRPRDGTKFGAFWRRPNWSGPNARPVPEPPVEPELLRRMEHLRTDYQEQRLEESVREATDLEAAAAEHIKQADGPLLGLLALAGAAATLLGLARQLIGDPDKAQPAFERAVSAFDKAKDFLTGRGEYVAAFGIALAMAGQHPAEAEQLLRRAAELGEDTPDVRRSLALSLRDAGHTQQALEVLDDAVRRAPYDWRALQARAELMDDRKAAAAADVAAAWARTGDALLAAGLPEQAKRPYRRAVELTPEDADLHLGLADALSRAGHRLEAIESLRRAADLPSDEEIALSVAGGLIDLGDPEKALGVTNTLIRRDPDHAHALDLKATALLLLDRSAEALAVLDGRKKTAPQDSGLHVLRGLALSSAGRREEAVQALETADSLHPEQPDVLQRLGAAFAEVGRGDDARRVLDQALKRSPDDPAVLLLRGQLQADMGDLKAAEADLDRAAEIATEPASALASLGFVLARQDRSAEALASLDNAVTADPGMEWAWAIRGDTLSTLRRWKDAATSYERALALDPAFTPAMTGLAQALLEVDEPDPERARALAQRAVDLDATSVLGHTMVGEVARQQAHYDEALAALDEALRLEPRYAYALGTRGQVLHALQRLPEAIESLERAAELAPDTAWIQSALGNVYLQASLRARRTGDPDIVPDDLRHAVQRLERAAELLPSPEAWMNAAQVRADLGEFDIAERDLRRALDVEPGHLDARLGLARLLSLTEHGEEALTELERAAGGDELPPYGETIRGRSLYTLGRYEESAASLEAAVRRAPEDQEAHAALGETYRVTGQLDAALAQLNAAVELDGDDAWALASRGAVFGALDDEARALADLHRALELAPDYLFAWSQLRSLLESWNRQEEAVTQLAEANARNPDDPDLLMEYAQALSSAGQNQEALAVLDEVLWRKPDEALATRLYGWTLLSLGRHTEAVSCFERAAQADPHNEVALNDLAEAKTRCGQVDEALQIIERALSVSRTRSTFTAKSGILARIGAWSDAVTAAREAVALPPEEATAHAALGWSLEHIGAAARDEALAAYATALEIAPRDVWALQGKADTIWSLRGPDVARAEYFGIIDVLGTAPPPEKLQLNGWCLYRLQRYSEAAETYLRARATTTDLASLLFDMGLNDLERGDPDWAAETYKKALEEVERQGSPLGCGTIAVALDDLNTAAEHPNPERDPAATDLLRQRLAEAYRTLAGKFAVTRATP